MLRDRARTADLVARAAEAGCRALVLTGDTPVLGRRRRDERNAFRMHLDLEPSGRDRGAEQDPSITFAAIEWLAGLAGHHLPAGHARTLGLPAVADAIDAGGASDRPIVEAITSAGGAGGALLILDNVEDPPLGSR